MYYIYIYTHYVYHVYIYIYIFIQPWIVVADWWETLSGMPSPPHADGCRCEWPAQHLYTLGWTWGDHDFQGISENPPF